MTTLKTRSNGIHSESFFTAFDLKNCFQGEDAFSFDEKSLRKKWRLWIKKTKISRI